MVFAPGKLRKKGRFVNTIAPWPVLVRQALQFTKVQSIHCGGTCEKRWMTIKKLFRNWPMIKNVFRIE
jgi:hypothetical protein